MKDFIRKPFVSLGSFAQEGTIKMPNDVYIPPEQVSSIGVVGAGSVGASWITLFLAHGLNVNAYDPAPNAEELAREFVEEAWPSLMELLGLPVLAIPFENLRFFDSPEQVAIRSNVIQENVPERAELKADILKIIDAHAAPEKIILSSTGGISPSTLQASCTHPERFVVVHPFNPAHLIPLVEVVGGQHTLPETVDWAMRFARVVGKHPIHLKREASGHLTNRLQFALLREAVHCLVEGIAGAKDIDDAVRFGLGPRWTLMGSLLTLHLAGGQGGMKGILNHAGEAIDGWWSALGRPHMTSEVKAKLIEASIAVANGHSVSEWVEWRDKNLTQVLRLLQSESQPGAIRNL